uniref:U5 small nuclear ribonucleoprotein TSSC4 n=1 Tax=Culex tarsalis TaxID=7177 RepID=A0A1Q3FGW0_CULTA
MSFEDKKKALFASLDSAEKSIPSNSVLHQDQNVDYSRRPGSDSRHTSSREPIRKFRGKESIFKRPAAPIGKCLPMSRVPDFKKNPHKWTKYSLEDVDTSDRSNTAAAFSFLREMESKKQQEGGEQTDDDGGGGRSTELKVRFNRSVKLQARLEEVDRPPPSTEEDKPKVKGCKVVMPEYVIGQKPKKVRAGKKVVGGAGGGGAVKRDRSSELKLDHLMEEEEDDEEDDNDGID